jgi:hypothetical protein
MCKTCKVVESNNICQFCTKLCNSAIGISVKLAPQNRASLKFRTALEVRFRQPALIGKKAQFMEPYLLENYCAREEE